MKHAPYLWRRPNGTYYVIHYDGPLNEQKRMESLKTKDKRTARDRLALWQHQRAQAATERVPLGTAIDEYLRHFAQRNKAISVRRYRAALNHVTAYLGDATLLRHVHARALQDYQLERVQDADKSTVDYELGVFRTFLNWSKRRAWVEENVADHEHVERLTTKRDRHKKKRLFTDDELAALLEPDQPGHWQYPYIFHTLYYTGLRIGELSTLTTEDVNRDKAEISIRAKTLDLPVWDRQHGLVAKRVEWTPKWYRERIVPIEERLAPLLADYEERRRPHRYNLYFCGVRGTRITDHLSRPIQQRTGTSDVSVHTFRHTHISHALNRWGRHPSVVQAWVGHTDLKTTMHYLHVETADLHREAKKTGE